MKHLLIALAVGTALHAPAQARVPAIVDARTDADALVAQLASDSAMARLGARAFDHGVEQEIAADPAIKATYAANPGLKAHVVAQLRGEFLKIMQRQLPALRSQLSQVVRTEMSAVEIADTLTFFQSPVGQKLKEQVYASMSDKPGQSPDEARQAAMTAVMSNLTAEDYPALMAFGASSAAQKMQAVNPKIAATSEAWAKKLVADSDARMRALAAEAAAAYLKRRTG
ncbi:hypothetical protein [Sphingomonas sp. M1-B02]|uniref:hypothetical protein n=1 Tax=Sphingomonas sp. M1-B02 TaxID=3114300 RepID=UPI00223F1B7D|nr:hypothetical protein [Sphingomonas sp. S6-11]UZK65347.1 hypothetical protein OKW87_12600 [Sphingomonas sp. S6-11]